MHFLGHKLWILKFLKTVVIIIFLITFNCLNIKTIYFIAYLHEENVLASSPLEAMKALISSELS